MTAAALRLCVDEVPALFSAAVARHQAGRESDAIALYRRILRLAPNLPEVHGNLGVALAGIGRLDEAEDQFQSALQRAPNNAWSYYGLAEVYKAMCNQEAAAEAEAQLAKTWIGDRALLQISKL